MSVILHPGQSHIYRELFIDRICRYSVDVCSRGWGKSYFAATCAATAVAELMNLSARVPNKIVYIIAPTFAQVTDIYFPILNYQLGMEDYTTKAASRDTGKFMFPRNVELKLVSFEAIERLRGFGAYFVVNDEPASWIVKPGLKEAWESIIQPMITTRWSEEIAAQWGAVSPGRALTIGTPKGYNYFYDMFNMQDTDPEWKSNHNDYHTSPYLSAKEIERVKHTIDPLKFNREYGAKFEDSGNSVFYCFDRKIHKRDDLPYFTSDEAIHCSIDFNVGIQATAFHAIRGGQVQTLDEFKGHPDTEQLAIAIRDKFPEHIKRGLVFAYPDPSGRSRKTSAPTGQTDFTILNRYGIKCLARSAAPAIADSVNAVNAKLKTAAGDINMFVSSKCTGVIQSFERTSWVENNPDTLTIDKKEGVEHFSDGIRYFIEYKWPIQSNNKSVIQAPKGRIV